MLGTCRGHRESLETQARGLGQRSRAKQVEQPVCRNWQSDPMKLPGYSGQPAGGRGWERESITRTPVSHPLSLLPQAYFQDQSLRYKQVVSDSPGLGPNSSNPHLQGTRMTVNMFSRSQASGQDLLSMTNIVTFLFNIKDI